MPRQGLLRRNILFWYREFRDDSPPKGWNECRQPTSCSVYDLSPTRGILGGDYATKVLRGSIKK